MRSGDTSPRSQTSQKEKEEGADPESQTTVKSLFVLVFCGAYLESPWLSSANRHR